MFDEMLLKFSNLGGAEVCKPCRSQKILQNDCSLPKIGFDTDENEPSKVWAMKGKVNVFEI